MSRTVSANALKAMFARETDEVFLATMRISHASFATIRIVNNTEPVVRSDGTYQPFPFFMSLPDDTDDQVPQVEVKFDNIDGTITDAIRTISGDKPKCSFDIVLASSPDVIEAGPFNFSILEATYDSATISCTLGFEEDVLNQSCPQGTYTPSNSPGLFV